jgi:hypothetical protein
MSLAWPGMLRALLHLHDNSFRRQAGGVIKASKNQSHAMAQ